jgi:hypothetical protein
MFTSTGYLQYDPGLGSDNYEPNWAMLICDDELSRYYAWFLKKYGLETWSNDKGLWKTHISIIKGDLIPNLNDWKKYDNYEIEFHYNHIVRYDNGRHAWLDIYSEDLATIREELGLDYKPWYHLTIGRLKRPFKTK